MGRRSNCGLWPLAKPGLLSRLRRGGGLGDIGYNEAGMVLSGLSSAGLGSAAIGAWLDGQSLAGDIVSTLEARALWARFGL